MTVKAQLKRWIPPPVMRGLRRLNLSGSSTWSGRFHSWDEAARAARGYDDPAILEHIIEATQHARATNTLERDGSPIDETTVRSWPLLTGLLWALSRAPTPSVVDWGGGLGSTFHHVQPWLERLGPVTWRVVEQPHVADAGRQRFQTRGLTFHSELAEAMTPVPEMVICGSSLQYFSDGVGALRRLRRFHVTSVLIERTPFVEGPSDVLCVQRVLRPYSATYPCWLFSKTQLEATVAALGGRVQAWWVDDEQPIGQATLGGCLLTWPGATT